MKRTVILLSALFSTVAFSKEFPFYFGADGQYCKMCFKRNFGDNLYKRNSIGANPFLGMNINSLFAIETGYQYLSASKTSTLPAGEYSAGTLVLPIVAPVTFKSSFILKGPHIDFFVLTPTYNQLPLQFFGGLGVSQTKAIFQRKTLQLDGIIGTTHRRLETSRSLRRITLGSNYFFNPDFALRATLVFINAQKLHAFASDGIFSYYIPEVRPENTICYGLGLRWGF